MKAIILGAGFGNRMGDLTRTTPKPMLKVSGKPILEHILVNLKRNGFTEFAINLHFQPEQIKKYFGDGAKWGVNIVYADEAQLSGTAGVVRVFNDFLKSEPEVLIHYGDVITDQNFSSMIRQHAQKNAFATILVHRRKNSNSIVQLDNQSRVIDFKERPARMSSEMTYVNSGVQIVSREAMDLVCGLPQSVVDWPKDIYQKFYSTKLIYGFPLTGKRIAIDSPDKLSEANRIF